MNTSDLVLALVGLAAILLGIAISGGAFGPSDLEVFIQTSNPL
jgi:hypothetical protein